MDDTLPEGIPELTVVRDLLAAHVPGVGPLRASLLSGGRSNLTYSLTDGAGRWVLRRPPLGHVLATAHDMGREYRVMHALAPTPRAGTAHDPRAPRPRPARSPVLRHGARRGRRLPRRRRLTGTSTPTRAGASGTRSSTPSRRCTSSTPPTSGLADFGRAEGYLARQVRRWTDAAGLVAVPRRARLRRPRARGWPTTCRPRSAASIVHGDYRLDNVIVARTTPAGCWRSSTGRWPPSATRSPTWPCSASTGRAGAGWTTRSPRPPPSTASRAAAALARRYADATGLDLGDDDGALDGWYRAFAFFKIAVICEGIHYRHVHGLTVGEGFDQIGALVPEIVWRGLDALGAGTRA